MSKISYGLDTIILFSILVILFITFLLSLLFNNKKEGFLLGKSEIGNECNEKNPCKYNNKCICGKCAMCNNWSGITCTSY